MAVEPLGGVTEITKQVNIDIAAVIASDWIQHYWRSPDNIIPYGHQFYGQGRWPFRHSIRSCITQQ